MLSLGNYFMHPLPSIILIASIALSTLHAEDWQPEPGFISLFNGKDPVFIVFKLFKCLMQSKQCAFLPNHFYTNLQPFDVHVVLSDEVYYLC